MSSTLATRLSSQALTNETVIFLEKSQSTLRKKEKELLEELGELNNEADIVAKAAQTLEIEQKLSDVRTRTSSNSQLLDGLGRDILFKPETGGALLRVSSDDGEELWLIFCNNPACPIVFDREGLKEHLKQLFDLETSIMSTDCDLVQKLFSGSRIEVGGIFSYTPPRARLNETIRWKILEILNE